MYMYILQHDLYIQSCYRTDIPKSAIYKPSAYIHTAGDKLQMAQGDRMRTILFQFDSVRNSGWGGGEGGRGKVMEGGRE